MTRSKHPQFDLMLFDLDGTLMETTGELADAINDLLADEGLPPVLQAQIDAWVGHGTRALVATALGHAKGTEADQERQAPGFAARAQLFDQHYAARCGTRSRLYPHVGEVLLALQALGVCLVVLTNKDEAFARTLLRAHGVDAYFTAVIGGDSLPVRKPDPMGILRTMAEHGVAADRTLFVGDSSVDVATGRRAGVAVWAVPYGYNLGQPIESAQPDRVIPDFRALLPPATL